MVQKFDLQAKKSHVTGSMGIDRSINESVSELRSKNALTARCDSALNQAMFGIIVGLHEPALQLVEKALEWVSIAIEEQERPMYYSPHGTEARRYFCKAFALWLLGRSIDDELVELYVADSTAYQQGKGKDKIGISFSLPDFVALEAYEPALDVWRQCGYFQPPPAIGRIGNEANMCYVVANSRLGREYSPDDEQLAITRFLKRNVNTKWLGRGHAMTAAKWMKIAFWQPGDDPVATVMRCHEFL